MAAVRCIYCSRALPSAQVAAGSGAVWCVGCRESSSVIALPALLEDGKPKPPPLLEAPGEGEAACFYSPGRKATKECSHCGVLISDVWAAQWGSQVVCLKCLEHLRDTTKDVAFQSKRVLWDNITVVLALAPFTLILYFLAPFTAPAAVLLGLWHWNSPRSLVPRSRLRLVLALLLGLLQVGAGIFAICGLWFGWFK